MAGSPSDRVPARWGQLTYSSFDRHDGTGGGWQVKDTTGALDRDEQEYLRARVQTQFDAGVDLPRFPTPAELEGLPRRLVYAPAALRSSGTALWHHVPAGSDASGRPGNVFAHVVLDRNPDAYDITRPIERWRSTDWLTPFGPDAVLKAELTAVEPPRPGPLNRQMIGSWLFAPRQWRLQTLAVLLDAVRAAFGGGPLVVLAAEDVDEAAHWIAAVSCAMSAGTARRFFCSTLERPATLAEAMDRGLYLACVPRSDLPALQRREGVVVVDPAGGVELGDLDGEPHRTARGDRIDVGEWSVLVQEIFADPATLTSAVTEFDRLAHSIGDSGLDPAWPAAMLVSQRTAAGSRREAARVMAECAPPQLRSVPELYATAVTGLHDQVEGQVDLAWRHAVKLGADEVHDPATVAGEVAVGVYAELALADERWLAERGPARLPSAHYYSPAPEPHLVRLAALLCERIIPVHADLPPAARLGKARAGLHFVELTLRLGLAHDEELARRLWRVCQQGIVPVLLDRQLGVELAESVEQTVARETRHWLWSQLTAAVPTTGVPGERLAGAVLDMLGPGPDDPDPLAAAWAWLSDHPRPDEATISPLLEEWAWQRVRAGDAGPDARFIAVWGHLQAFDTTGDAGLLEQAGALLTPTWAVERLLQLHLRWTTTVPPDWFIRALTEAPLTDPAAGFLGGELTTRKGAVGRFARVRGALASPEWLAASGSDAVTDPARLGDAVKALSDGLALASQRGAEPDRTLLRRANGLVVLSLLAARSRVVPEAAALERAAGLAQAAIMALPGATAGFTVEETTDLVAWCDRVGVASTALTELFLLADPRSMLRAPGDRVAGWLHAIGTGEPGNAPLTARVLAARLSRNAESRERTTDEIYAALRSTRGSSDERATRQTERFLAGWLRQAQTGRVRR